ncbi:MAG: hypothetical protein EAY81_03650, partial [Bacteroidetes bacterium]
MAVAQTPQFISTNLTGGANSIPFNFASNKAQFLYDPNAFPGAFPGLITKVWVRPSSSFTGSLTNFEIKLGQTTATALAIGPYITNMQTCFTAASFPVSTVANNWFEFTLTTPFMYNPSQSLVIEYSMNSTTGFTINQTTPGGGNKRAWSANGLPSSTGSDGLQPAAGINVILASGNDAGVDAFLSPLVYSTGNNSVQARIKNFGLNQVANVDVNWSINNVPQTPYVHTSILDTLNGVGSQTANVTLGTVNLQPNIIYTLKAWTSMPNGVIDTSRFNDTLVRLIRSPLNGTFTVGATGDFLTLKDAINILNNSGISGPVTFELIDNLYSTQTGETFPLTIGNYSGMDASRPVTFRPSSTSTPLIIDSNANHIFILDGAKYVTFDGRQSPTDVNKNITIENRSRGINAGVVRYINDAIGCSMRNCIIRGSNNTTNATAQPVIGLVSIGGTNRTVPFGNDSITIFNNTFAQSNGLVYSHALVVDGQNITAQNDVINIDSNWFQGFGFNGVLVTTSASNFGNGSYFNIRGNSFYDTAQTVGTSVTTAITAINFIPASNSGSNFNVIDGNFIGGKEPFAGGIVQATGQSKWEFSATRTTGAFTGISTSVGTLSGVSITRNVIRNIWLYSTGSYVVTGIAHTVGNATIGGSPGMGNQIGMQ